MSEPDSVSFMMHCQKSGLNSVLINKIINLHLLTKENVFESLKLNNSGEILKLILSDYLNRYKLIKYDKVIVPQKLKISEIKPKTNPLFFTNSNEKYAVPVYEWLKDIDDQQFTGSLICSDFSEICFLTCAHCILKFVEDKYYIVLNNKKYYLTNPHTYLGYNTIVNNIEYDICVLEIKNINMKSVYGHNIPVEFIKENLTINELTKHHINLDYKVLMITTYNNIGFDKRLWVNFEGLIGFGLVTEIKTDNSYLHKYVTEGGYSGSPLIMHNSVCGLHYGGYDEEYNLIIVFPENITGSIRNYIKNLNPYECDNNVIKIKYNKFINE